MMENKKRSQLFYGWPLAIILGFMFFMANGSLLTSASISNPLMAEDLAMTATELGFSFSLVIFLYGIGAPICGFIISRIGARFTQMLGGALFIAASLTLFFFVKDSLLFYIAFSVMGLASMMVGQMSVETTMGAWFHRRRGVAMALAMSIGGLGAFISPLVANALIGWGGTWRSAWLFFCAAGVLAVLLSLFFVKNKPSEIGEVPDGREAVSEATSDVPADVEGKTVAETSLKDNSQTTASGPVKERVGTGVYKHRDGLGFSESLRSPAYWLICTTGFCGYLFYSLATGQSTAHFASIGIDRLAIVGGMSSFGLAALVGRLAWGSISDRFEPIRLMAICDLLIASAIVIGALAVNEAMLYAFYLIAGFAYGGIVPNLPTAIANRFGSKCLANNLGIVMMVCGLTSAVVPVLGGLLFDLTGSYAPIFIGTAAVVVVGAISGFCVQRPDRVSRHNRVSCHNTKN